MASRAEAAAETAELRSPGGSLEATFVPRIGMLGWSLRHDGEELLGHPVTLDRYAATGEPWILGRINYIVDELAACQQANGDAHEDGEDDRTEQVAFAERGEDVLRYGVQDQFVEVDALAQTVQVLGVGTMNGGALADPRDR